MPSKNLMYSTTKQVFVLDMATIQLWGTAVVDLSDLESALLFAFANAPDGRMATQELLQIGGKNAANVPCKSVLQVQITRLRKKIEKAGASAPTIKAIRGVGYKLCVPVKCNV